MTINDFGFLIVGMLAAALALAKLWEATHTTSVPNPFSSKPDESIL